MNYWNNYLYNQSLRSMASQNVHDLVRKDHEHRDNAMYEYYNNKITKFMNDLNSHLHDMLQQLRNDYRITVAFDLFFLTTNYEKELYHELKHLVTRYNLKLIKLFKTSKFTLYNVLTEHDRKVIYRNIILHNDFLYYTKRLLDFYKYDAVVTPFKDTIVKELNKALQKLQTTINSYLQLNFNLNQQILKINNNSPLYVPPPRHYHHHRTNLLMRI